MFRGAPPALSCFASPASFLLPAPGLRAARPFFARIACARVRASRAGAVRAPDCAREPSARHTSPVRSVGDFSRRRETGDEAASGCRSLVSHSTMDFSGSSPLRGIISPFLELVRQVGRSCPDRPPVEPVPPRGDAFGQRLLGPAGEGHRLARDLAVGRAGCGERGARRRRCAGPRPLHDPRRRDRPTGL